MGSEKMKVIILGLPQFAKKLASNLSLYDTSNKYIALNTYYNHWDKLRYCFHLLSADAVYSLNGTISYSKALSMALKMKKKVLMHWVGTDVISAQNDYTRNKVNDKYVSEVKHFCEVNWIKEELKEIGINAEIVNFVTFEKEISTNVAFPKSFSILTYIGKNREEFYGINEIIVLAKRLPDIPVNVVGIKEYHEVLPPNINLLGWVNNMDDLIEFSVVCLRFPFHDGLSSFILEALAKGRHIVYKYDYPNCNKAEDLDSLIDTVKNLKKSFDEKKLDINKEGIVFILNNFNKDYILGKLVGRFKQIVHGT